MINNEIFLNIVEEHNKITENKNIDKKCLEEFYEKCYKIKEEWEDLLIKNNGCMGEILNNSKKELLKNRRELEYLINELYESIEYYHNLIQTKKEFYLNSIVKDNIDKNKSIQEDLYKLNKIKFDKELNFTVISKNIIQLKFKTELLNEKKKQGLILLRKKNINNIYTINNFKDSKKSILKNIEDNKKKINIYENKINNELFKEFLLIEEKFNNKKEVFIKNINDCKNKIINNKNKEEVKTLNLEIVFYNNKILNFDKDLYNEKVKFEENSYKKINKYNQSINNLNCKLKENIENIENKYIKFIDNYYYDNNINNIKIQINRIKYTIIQLENKNKDISNTIIDLNNKILNLTINEENTKKVYIKLLAKNYSSFIKQKKFLNIIIKNKEDDLQRYRKKLKNSEKLLIDIIINKSINSHDYNSLKRKKIFLLKKIDYLNKLFLIL